MKINIILIPYNTAVKKCSELLPSASRNALRPFLTVAAVAQMYLSSIASLISSTAFLRSSMDPGPLKFDPLPQQKDAEVAIRGMQPRDRQQSQNYFSSFEQIQEEQ